MDFVTSNCSVSTRFSFTCCVSVLPLKLSPYSSGTSVKPAGVRDRARSRISRFRLVRHSHSLFVFVVVIVVRLRRDDGWGRSLSRLRATGVSSRPSYAVIAVVAAAAVVVVVVQSAVAYPVSSSRRRCYTDRVACARSKTFHQGRDEGNEPA